MKNFLIELGQNQTFWIAALAYFSASILKVFVEFLKTKRIKPYLFFSSGGMPSSHSAFIAAAATVLGMIEGFDSSVFALGAVIGIVIMYDAQGVRRASGKQAEAINRIIQNSDNLSAVLEKELKEILGHTPFEVLTGALMGIVLAVILAR